MSASKWQTEGDYCLAKLIGRYNNVQRGINPNDDEEVS